MSAKIVYDKERSDEEQITTYTVKDDDGNELAHIHTEKDMDVLVLGTSMFVHTNKKREE